MSLEKDARLGPYEILCPLGAGGMGEVYKARDTRLGRDVAVKVLPAEFTADPERLRRFEQEARAAAALNHPNILVLHDMGTHEGSPFIVTELLEGATLRERLRGGPLLLANAVDFGLQIAKGLAAAHEKGIVHRDLKPENLFVTKDGHVKILDFGLARLRPEADGSPPQSQAPTSDSPTRAGSILGTPGYMAPEQARGLPCDFRTDIFAFGAVLYEMLAGERAFTGETNTDVTVAILTKEPPPLAKEVPPSLDRVLRRCLEKRPDDRFSSARDLAFALEAGTQSGEALRDRESLARLAALRRWGAALLAVLLIALVAGGLLAWKPWRAMSTPTGVAAGGAPSLVALPCKVFGAPEAAYLADAVPNTISTLLGEVTGLDTRIPPTSVEVEAVQGDLGKIASAYGVQALVVSTVTVEGDHLLFNVQLADAKTRKVRWSHQYQGSR